MNFSRERLAVRNEGRSEHEPAAKKPAPFEGPSLVARGLTLEGLGNRALLSLLRSGRLQRKARVSQPADPLERDADCAADAIVSGAYAHTAHQNISGDVQRMPTEDEKLARALGLGSSSAREDVQSTVPEDEADTRAAEVVGQLYGGRNLDESTRALMESRFGESFSDVRIHIGHRAGELADSLQSRAFTVGENIVFAESQFAPETTEGQRVLAHELAHVIQQRRPTGPVASEKDAERDARESARELARGGTPDVRERAAPGTVQKQGNEEEEQIATTKPRVHTSTAYYNSDSSSVAIHLETHPDPIAVGTTASFDLPHDNGGIWDPGARTLAIRVFLKSYASLRAAGKAGDVARDLNLNLIVIIPVVEGEDQPEIVITPTKQQPPKPAPTAKRQPTQPAPLKPSRPPVPSPPQIAIRPDAERSQVELAAAPPRREPEFVQAVTPTLSPDLAARVTKIQSNLKSFTFNPFWRTEIIDAFKGLSPSEFQQLQDQLGENDMNEVFDQLDPFYATLVGTFGPITKGQSKLNEKRVEFILSTKDWGAVKEAFYRWMFDIMRGDEISFVLNRVAAEKRLPDTILSVPGLVEYLNRRGVPIPEQSPTTAYEGIKRGLEGFWTQAWSGTIFSGGPSFEYTYLPDEYQKLYFHNLGLEFEKAVTSGNVARGAASHVTLGVSDIPIGIYGAGKATIGGISDIAGGKSGEGAEKLTSVVLTILTILVGRKVAKLSAASALEESAILEGGAGPIARTPINWEVRSLGKTASGLDRFIARHISGEFVELLVDQEKGNIKATHIATGATILYENGQITRGPAGLLPPPTVSWPTGFEPLGREAPTLTISPLGAPPSLAPPLAPPTLLPAAPRALAGSVVGNLPEALGGAGLTIELKPSQVEKLLSAEQAAKWTDLPGPVRTSLGKRYGYIVQELTREIASGGRAKAVLHWPLVDADLISRLKATGGRVVITEGRLKGGDLRFDFAEIDFDRGKVEVLDLTPSKDPAHIAKTAAYAEELRKLTGFEVESFELLYVGEEGELLPELEKLAPKK